MGTAAHLTYPLLAVGSLEYIMLGSLPASARMLPICCNIAFLAPQQVVICNLLCNNWVSLLFVISSFSILNQFYLIDDSGDTDI